MFEIERERMIGALTIKPNHNCRAKTSRVMQQLARIAGLGPVATPRQSLRRPTSYSPIRGGPIAVALDNK